MQYKKAWTVVPERNHVQVGPLIDWTWAQGWLRELNDREKAALYPAMSAPSALKLDFSSRETADVRVVDVVQNCVILLPPGAEYLALSYVWGVQDGAQHFQTTESNVQALEQTGSLEKHSLPATISDAMDVCRNLGQRYLWVDRLCIIQDGSWNHKSVQLNQMAIVYGRAALTIVAAEGNSADYGLEGMSLPRCQSRTLQVTDTFMVVKEAPPMYEILGNCEWNRRGWTYQENLASSRLLLFTKFGLILRDKCGAQVLTYSEGPVDFANGGAWNIDQVSILLAEYTGKVLTYPCDKLNAITGILHVLYGRRVSHGMPWDAFDNFILWVPVNAGCVVASDTPRAATDSAIFPSWSWASAYGPVEFGAEWDTIFSLAYWGMKIDGLCKSHESTRWEPAGPPNELSAKIMLKGAALAWQQGCLRSKMPE